MWYYALDDERKGPVDKDEIQRLISDGDLGMDDLVWTDGMDDWTPVSEVEDLRPSPPPLPDDEQTPPSQEGDTPTNRDATLSAESTDRVGSKTVGITYAGFGSRLVAYGIDILITVVVSVILGAVVLSADSSADPDLLTRGIGFLVTWFYFAGFESSKRQATPGKQLMGLKVTDASMGYDRIGFRKASGRHFGKIISGALLLLGFIMAAFTERKQALHDKMAGCLVIKAS